MCGGHGECLVRLSQRSAGPGLLRLAAVHGLFRSSYVRKGSTKVVILSGFFMRFLGSFLSFVIVVFRYFYLFIKSHVFLFLCVRVRVADFFAGAA